LSLLGRLWEGCKDEVQAAVVENEAVDLIDSRGETRIVCHLIKS